MFNLVLYCLFVILDNMFDSPIGIESSIKMDILLLWKISISIKL